MNSPLDNTFEENGEELVQKHAYNGKRILIAMLAAVLD